MGATTSLYDCVNTCVLCKLFAISLKIVFAQFHLNRIFVVKSMQERCALIGSIHLSPSIQRDRVMANVASGWELRESRSSGKSYYYNTYTGGTQWDMPATPGKGQVQKLLYNYS